MFLDINVNFSLSSTSVSGLLGGDEASYTVALTQVSSNRRWWGWYNSPGLYVTGKRFRRLAHSAKADIMLDSDSKEGAPSGRVHIDPLVLFAHEGWSAGPAFNGIYCGTSIRTTGPLASWLMKRAANADYQQTEGRKVQPVNVTVIQLEQVDSLRPQMTFDHPEPYLASIPIFSSLFTCAVSGWNRQWYACSVILLGTLSRGLACFFMGSGDLIFDYPNSAYGSPSGDGILGSDHELVLLKGNANVVNAVTRGRFLFRFWKEYTCRIVEWCSILLIIPAIAQLILIPQSDFFGQLMFVVSIAISWAYNLWLSFHDKAKVEETIFKEILGTPRLRKFAFRNRTSAVAFVLLILKDDPVFLVVWKKILDIYLPWGPRVWEIWREVIIERLERRESFAFAESLWKRKELTPQEQDLLRGLFQDAEDAAEAYNHLKNPELGIMTFSNALV